MFSSMFQDTRALLQFTGQAPASAESFRTNQEARILRAALGCFAEGGYAATTVRTIATEAGVTAPMINYYFGSKEALYRRIVELVALSLGEYLETAAVKDGDFRMRLMSLMTAAIDFATASPEAVAFMFDALYGCSGGRPQIDIDALERTAHGALERLIAGAVAGRELRLRDGCRVKDVQRLCMGVMEHVIGRDFARRDPVGAGRREHMLRQAEALFTIVMQGAAAKPEG